MKLTPLILAAMGALLPAGVFAEEGGSGHYMPGSISSFVDGLPPPDTFIARYNLVNYHGSRSLTQPLPIAGLDTVDADAASWAQGLTLLWSPPVDAQQPWSYAFSATIPVVWMDVSATVTAGGTPGRRSSSVTGLGDIVLMPVMVGYRFNPDFAMNFRIAGYAPTGSYEVGRLANTGKNFWSIEPTLGLAYFGQKNGREASLYLGSTFNLENPDTDYRSGTQVHVDGTLAQHFPLFGGLAGVGVSGYWYEQVTADSGAGANFGDFKGRTVGLGPVISHAFKAGGVGFTAEAKWLHETEVRNRLQGDTFWFKLVAKF